MTLGHVNVDRMLRGVTAKQFYEWKEYLREPRGDARADWRTAQVVSMIHNVNCTKEKHMKGPKDFLLEFKEPDQEVKVEKVPHKLWLDVVWAMYAAPGVDVGDEE